MRRGGNPDQLTLGGLTSSPGEPRRGGSAWTSSTPDRSGTAKYTHIIRFPDDPERSPRGHRASSTAWRAMRQWPLDRVCQELLQLLGDGRPRSFNRMCVELWDKTADICLDERPDQALWLLLGQGLVEWRNHPQWPGIEWRAVFTQGADYLGSKLED